MENPGHHSLKSEIYIYFIPEWWNIRWLNITVPLQKFWTNPKLRVVLLNYNKKRYTYTRQTQFMHVCSKRFTLIAFPELTLSKKRKWGITAGQDHDECVQNLSGGIPKQAVLTCCLLYEGVEKRIIQQEFKTKKQPLVKLKATADINNLHRCKKWTWEMVRKGKEVLVDKGIGYPSPESMGSFLGKDCYLLALFYGPKSSTVEETLLHLQGYLIWTSVVFL